MPGLPSNIAVAARWAIPLIWLALVGTALFGLLLMLDIWRGLGGPVHDVPPILLTLAIAGGRDPVFAMVMAAQTLAALAAAVWLFRAAKNAAALDPAPGVRVRPWMQLTWFAIPVFDLVMPLRGIRQIWATSVTRAPITTRLPGWAAIWWPCWVLSVYLPWLAPWDGLSFETRQTRLADSALELLSLPFYLIAGVFFLHIVRRVTAGQLAQGGTPDRPAPVLVPDQDKAPGAPRPSRVWDGRPDRVDQG